MSTDFDVIIIGSGPAGVSVAYPLLEAGFKVLMVDGGGEPDVELPSSKFLDERSKNNEQWKWFVGEDFHALKMMDAVSPKLRTPTNRFVFSKFNERQYVDAENFVAVGSLSKGGLSNAWGCGVARLSAHELSDFPFEESEIIQSYETVTRRVGVSGANSDALSNYFGLDEWSQPPVLLDHLHQSIYNHYSKSASKLSTLGFKMGRSRVAVISQDLGERNGCDNLGNCLWGCSRKSLYSSADELTSLFEFENFSYKKGFIVEDFFKDKCEIIVDGSDEKNNETIKAKKVILAAGTLATTRLTLKALKLDKTLNLQSSPTAAFLLWLPKKLGHKRENSFGLGQLSFSLKLSQQVSAFGSTFSTTGIPATEFVRHMPLGKRFSIDLLRHLLSSCLVGNVFLPGHLSTTSVSLDKNAKLKVIGGYKESVSGLFAESLKVLRKSYFKLGGIILPTSFTQGLPGGDVHYASTLPMRKSPTVGETDKNGELAELSGVYVVDGSCLTTLGEKSHTLTIMANADRIGRYIANEAN